MTPPLTGILGGTFDPVHLGHLELAEEAPRWLRLSGVLLMPCATPPHKTGRRLAPATHRLNMLRLALRNRPGMDVCELEVSRGGINYSIDSLRALRDADSPCDPVFMLGMDSLLDLPTWSRFDELLEEFHLLAFDRPSLRLEEVRERLHPAVLARLVELYAGSAPAQATRESRVFHADLSPIPVSSRAVRRRAWRGESLDALVPPAVAAYIQDNGIYRQEERH